MIRLSPALRKEADRAHGVSAHGILIDEIHVQKNPNLYNVLTKGSGDARRQPLQFIISTAGDNIHSIGYELFRKAQDILDGRKTDPTIYPVVYAADPGDDWTDPEVWKKANPSLGVTFPIEKLAEACESAKQNPSEVNSFLQLRLNIWTKQAVRWMPMDKWDACDTPIDAEALRGCPCYGGLDLSSTQDLTALVLVFPPRTEDEKYIVLPYCWIPEETIDLRSRKANKTDIILKKPDRVQNKDSKTLWTWDVVVPVAAKAISETAVDGYVPSVSPLEDDEVTITNARVVCKITYAGEGEKRTFHKIYATLEAAFEDINTEAALADKSDIRIEMLVPEYAMADGATLNAGKAATLTTADPDAEDGFPCMRRNRRCASP